MGIADEKFEEGEGEIVAIGYEKLMESEDEIVAIGYENFVESEGEILAIGYFLICILPKNLGLLWLCKANALLLQLPCGAEFELNVDALYMSLTNFPSLGIKGRAIVLYFIIVFILLVTELHVIYFWLHVLCTQSHVIYCCLHLLCIS